MAGIIKSGVNRTIRGAVRGTAFNLEDMTDHVTGKADQLLAEVRRRAAEEAARIVEEARQSASHVRAEAEAQGRAAAEKSFDQQLRTRLDAQVATLMPALEQAVAAIRDSRHAWARRWEQAAIEVVCQIAERVIRRELSQRPDITLDLVREALELATGHDRIQVSLHPADHAAIAGSVQQLVARLGIVAAVEVSADSELEPGGCRVETEFGSIDQQITSQLDRIQEELDG